MKIKLGKFLITVTAEDTSPEAQFTNAVYNRAGDMWLHSKCSNWRQTLIMAYREEYEDICTMIDAGKWVDAKMKKDKRFKFPPPIYGGGSSCRVVYF